jgi:hypothetical protein
MANRRVHATLYSAPDPWRYRVAARLGQSFSVPFLSSVGLAFYRFQGRMKNSYLDGELKVEYPSDPKYNEKEAVKLQKTEESQFPPMQ